MNRNLTLIFDTETTGLVNFKLPPFDSSQPRLVQLAALLCDSKSGDIVHQFGSVIKPLDYEIPANMVHGITTEYATEVGVSLDLAISLFNEFLQLADIVVAHNIKFDKPVIMAEMFRLNRLTWPSNKSEFCTMLWTTNICKIPSPFNKGYKWPKLTECYKHYFHSEYPNAHDAMADCLATRRIYFEGIKNINAGSGLLKDRFVQVVEPQVESTENLLKVEHPSNNGSLTEPFQSISQLPPCVE